MNLQSSRTAPAQDDHAATQPTAAPEGLALLPSPTDRLMLATRGDSLPHLTGEIRGLVYIRLREVALLVTVGWSLVLLLCLSGLDGLFNPARLGMECIGAMALTTVIFWSAGCYSASARSTRWAGSAEDVNPRTPLATLTAFGQLPWSGRHSDTSSCLSIPPIFTILPFPFFSISRAILGTIHFFSRREPT